MAVVTLALTASGKALLPAAAEASSRILCLPMPGLALQSLVGPEASYTAARPLAWSFCLATFGVACHRPSDIQNRYKAPPLWAKVGTGRGQTAVIVDSLGRLATGIDLATFDQVFGFAAAPSVDIYAQAGKVTCYCTHVQAGWVFHGETAQTELGLAYESPLDVGWAHAMAPRGPHQPGGGHLGSSPRGCTRSAKNHILYADACHGTTPGNNSFAGITSYSTAPGWNAATRPGTPGAAGPADALTHTTP